MAGTPYWPYEFPIQLSTNLCFQFSFCFSQSRSQSLRSPWPAVEKRHLWEQPFRACAIDADCAVKPDGQNHQNSVISKWLLPELSFSNRWSRGTKTLGTRLCFSWKLCSMDMLKLKSVRFSRRMFREISLKYLYKRSLCFEFICKAIKYYSILVCSNHSVLFSWTMNFERELNAWTKTFNFKIAVIAWEYFQVNTPRFGCRRYMPYLILNRRKRKNNGQQFMTLCRCNFASDKITFKSKD